MFQAQNGSTVAIKFGNRRVNSSLKLTFQNISDLEASRILRCYELVNGPWDYIEFTGVEACNEGFLKPSEYSPGSQLQEVFHVQYREGVDTDIRQYHKESGTLGKPEGPSGLKYRFTKPPVVRSVNRNVCTVTCEFTAFLDGALD